MGIGVSYKPIDQLSIAKALSNGDELVASQGGEEGRFILSKLKDFIVPKDYQVAYKAADQIVNNDMTLIDDLHLFLTLKSNKKYIIHGILMVDIHDLAVTFNAQLGLTVNNLIVHYTNQEEAEQTTTVAFDVIANFTVNEISGVAFHGTIDVNVGGKLMTQWAQPFTNPVDSTMKKGSYMEAQEI